MPRVISAAHVTNSSLLHQPAYNNIHHCPPRSGLVGSWRGGPTLRCKKKKHFAKKNPPTTGLFGCVTCRCAHGFREQRGARNYVGHYHSVKKILYPYKYKQQCLYWITVAKAPIKVHLDQSLKPPRPLRGHKSSLKIAKTRWRCAHIGIRTEPSCCVREIRTGAWRVPLTADR